MPLQAESTRLANLFKAGEYESLEIEARRLIDRFPDSGFAWKALGTALQMQKKTSLHVLQRAAELLPDDAEAHSNLGNALREKGMLGEASASYRRALELAPNHVPALCNLGSVLNEKGYFAESLACFRRAIAVNPENEVVHYNLGNILRAAGMHDQAVASYRRSLECDANLVEARSNLLFSLNLHPSATAEEKFEEAVRFGNFAAHKAQKYRSWANRADSNRCLRVGLVSGDFRNHAVGYFLLGGLAELAGNAADRLKLYAYSNNLHADELTEAIKACCHVWRSVGALSDRALAEQIRADGIDILIDLSGHTACNRLLMFAWKPAPVQVTWLGYFATTGVEAIDYLIADPWTLPNSEEQWFIERIWRLPETRLCFSAPTEHAEVSPLPALANGYVTFGCFNNLSKLNDDVVVLWSKILASVPASRLFLKSLQLKDAWMHQETIKRFAVHGIGDERIVLEGFEPRAKYLAAYQRVDITLDPFPYPGGTTTVESLWMGVPVLTLEGDCFLSRQGVGLLINADLPDWIAADAEDYVSRAVSHANNLQLLASLRQGLRQKLMLSPVFDTPRFAYHLEQALRGMWQRWCAEQHSNRISEISEMKIFLHVGCGSKRKDKTTQGFNTPEWQELRLDIDESVQPDIVGTILDMSAVPDASVDAVYSSHNIEHLYPHELPVALKEFLRVLKPDGFLVLACPDLQSVCALIAEDKLTEPAYNVPAGSVAPIDILYGWRLAMAKGNLFMAHRCGFTLKVLLATLKGIGFASVAGKARGRAPFFDLWAVASKPNRSEDEMRALAAQHFPT